MSGKLLIYNNCRDCCACVDLTPKVHTFFLKRNCLGGKWHLFFVSVKVFHNIDYEDNITNDISMYSNFLRCLEIFYFCFRNIYDENLNAYFVVS